jgi:Transglutaminase-like superfamily
MQRLRRFIRLSSPERSLVIQAMLATSVIRLSLPWLSLRSVQRLSAALIWGSTGLTSKHIVWSVLSAAHLIPQSTCLVQALAAQALLTRHGYRPRLTIGVTKPTCESFEAHAWITCNDEVLIGGQKGENYTALLVLDSRG